MGKVIGRALIKDKTICGHVHSKGGGGPTTKTLSICQPLLSMFFFISIDPNSTGWNSTWCESTTSARLHAWTNPAPSMYCGHIRVTNWALYLSRAGQIRLRTIFSFIKSYKIQTLTLFFSRFSNTIICLFVC